MQPGLVLLPTDSAIRLDYRACMLFFNSIISVIHWDTYVYYHDFKKSFNGTGIEVVLEKPVWVGKLPEEDELIVDNLYYSHSPLCNALLEYLFLISNSITMSPTTNGNHCFVVMLTSHKIDKRQHHGSDAGSTFAVSVRTRRGSSSVSVSRPFWLLHKLGGWDLQVFRQLDEVGFSREGAGRPSMMSRRTWSS